MRLGNQEHDDPDGVIPGHALGDQLLEIPHHRRQRQDEREDQQRQEERRQDLAQDVAVKDSQHVAEIWTIARRGGYGSAAVQVSSSQRSTLGQQPEEPPQTFHRALLLAVSLGSDNECYVN